MPNFTQSELRVLEQLAAGHTYQHIACFLRSSPATVRYHARRMQERLGVPNNAALVGVGIVAGLLADDTWPTVLTGLTEVELPMA